MIVYFEKEEYKKECIYSNFHIIDSSNLSDVLNARLNFLGCVREIFYNHTTIEYDSQNIDVRYKIKKAALRNYGGLNKYKIWLNTEACLSKKYITPNDLRFIDFSIYDIRRKKLERIKKVN